MLDKINKINIAIFICLLFHVSGLIGMFTSSKSWFISMTPLTLLLMFGLMAWIEGINNKKFVIYTIIAFVTGVLVEVIGVNTSLLFGNYYYGKAMGIKLLGVPLLMGIQWLVTMVGIAHLIYYIMSKGNWMLSTFSFSLIAAFVATMFDYFIEPIAMSFDYWQWENGVIPAYNYVCWYVISFMLFYIYDKYFTPEKINFYNVVLIVTQMIFFIILGFSL